MDPLSVLANVASGNIDKSSVPPCETSEDGSVTMEGNTKVDVDMHLTHDRDHKCNVFGDNFSSKAERAVNISGVEDMLLQKKDKDGEEEAKPRAWREKGGSRKQRQKKK